MTSRRVKGGYSTRAFFSASFALGLMGHGTAAMAQTVQDRALSRVTATDDGACSTVAVEFNLPVRYQSHFPQGGGRELRIAIRPTTLALNGLGGSFGAESIRPPASKVAGIQQITYDANDPAGPTLTVQFDHDAQWSVQPDNDVTKIMIRVARAGADGCIPASAGPAPNADMILSVTSVVPPTLDPNGNYSINLASNRGSLVAPESVKPLDQFNEYVGYAYSAEENGATWARLRLGMFATRAEAEEVLAETKPVYPDAWVVRIDRAERDSVYQAWLSARGKAATTSDLVKPGALPFNAEAEEMLVEARALLAAGAFPDAVRLAEKILGQPESSATPSAQEVLGMARERAGQLAHAKAEYETFLQRYPDNEAAPRVRQRLAVLIGGEEAAAPSATDDSEANVKKRSSLHAEASGSLSALYQRDESGFLFEDTPVVGGPEVNPDPIEETRTNLNEMIYGADLSLSVGTDRNEALIRFSGLYRDDLRLDAPRDQGAISALYLDLSDREFNAAMRFGRQTKNTGGVFGRFDGASASVQPTDWLKLNVAAGFPVQSSRDLEVKSERKFGSVSVDLSLIPDKLDTTFYTLAQDYGSLVDRRAVGFEFRYFDTKRTAYGVFDYDTHYGQLNLGLLNGTLRFEDESTVSLAVDYRRSPLLTTQNAVFGQMVEDPEELLPTYTDKEIYRLAEDRTGYSRSAALSYSKPLTPTLQLNTDVIATNVSSTKASGGVEAQPATGMEYYYSAQLVGSDVFKKGAILTAGIRYSDQQMTNQYTLQINGRYPVTKDLRINPRLRVDQRERKDGSSSELSTRGSILTTYNWNRIAQFEFEIGGQFADGDNTFGSTRETGYFLTMGVRRDF